MNKITTERLMKSKIMVVSKKNADKISKAMYEKMDSYREFCSI